MSPHLQVHREDSVIYIDYTYIMTDIYLRDRSLLKVLKPVRGLVCNS